MLINGQEYAWSNVRFMIAGVPMTGVSSIKYSMKQEKTNNYGIGSKPTSRSYGATEYDGSTTLHMSEVEGLTKVAPNRDITQVPPFDVIISFVEVAGRTPVVHKLRACEFMNNERDMKQGDNKLEVSLDLIIGDIEW